MSLETSLSHDMPLSSEIQLPVKYGSQRIRPLVYNYRRYEETVEYYQLLIDQKREAESEQHVLASVYNGVYVFRLESEGVVVKIPSYGGAQYAPPFQANLQTGTNLGKNSGYYVPSGALRYQALCKQILGNRASRDIQRPWDENEYL